MRGADGRLILDLNDSVSTRVTGSVLSVSRTSINENNTSYSLLPELINYPPYFETSVYNISEPSIQPIQYNDEGRNILYLDDDGVIKVKVGTSFILRCKAQQPPIYNVENGIPTLLTDTAVEDNAIRQVIDPNITINRLEPTSSIDGFLEKDLVYTWYKDDGSMTQELVDPTNSNSKIVVIENGKGLAFQDISTTFAGTYYCEVENDIGIVTTEQINIAVYNPDIEDLFYKNLVTNAYGATGIDGWSTGDDEFIASKLSTAEYTEFTKPWNQDVFGYSLDMFKPRPYHINTYNVRNSDLASALQTNGSYFTRDNFKITQLGGELVVRAEHDVDVSDLQSYIQGSVYGVSGVRAVFGCYLGNAVNRFIQTIITAVQSRRNFLYTVDPSKHRLSLINALIAGAPVLYEKATVRIVEYDNETPLATTQLVNMDTSEESLVYGIKVDDPWTSALIQAATQNINLIPQELSSGYKSPGNTSYERILSVANQFYPNNIGPTHGQYVEWNRKVISKLNYKTNKIRIVVEFRLNDNASPITEFVKDLNNETERPLEDYNWAGVTKPFWLPTSNDAKFKIADDYLNRWSYNERSMLGTVVDEFSKPPITEYTALHPSPRALATGFNLVLFPIEEDKINKVTHFTKTILSPISDQLLYPQLSSSITPIPNKFIDLVSEIQGYSSSIIYVDVTNNYNLPKKVDPSNQSWLLVSGSGAEKSLENLKAFGDVATATTITTFKFRSDNNLSVPIELEDLTLGSNISEQQNWQEIAPAYELLQQIGRNGASNIDVLYNPIADTVIQSAVPQLYGQLKSNLIKFVNNPIITYIPPEYELKQGLSYTEFDEIGFNLELLYDRYGTTPLSESVTLPTAYVNSWKQKVNNVVLNGVDYNRDELPSTLYNHKLFYAVEPVSGSQYFNLNEYANRQVLFYSNIAKNTNSLITINNYTTGSVFDLVDAYVKIPLSTQTTPWKYNISSSINNEVQAKLGAEFDYFLFNKQSNVGPHAQQELVKTFTSIREINVSQLPGYSYAVGNGYSNMIIDIIARALGNRAVQLNGYTGNTLGEQVEIEQTERGIDSRMRGLKTAAFNEVDTSLKELYGKEGKYGLWQQKYPTLLKCAYRQKYDIDNCKIEVLNIGTNEPADLTQISVDTANLYKIRVTNTVSACGGTYDRIKLLDVKPVGDFRTPAAIICKNSKKIYYFLYNYTDNMLGEE